MEADSRQIEEVEAARRRRYRLTGIALMCGAVISFSFLDAIAKYLNGHMDTLQVVWARYTGGFLLTLLISNPVSRPGLMQTKRPALQVVRSLFLVCSTVSNFLAFRYLQLDQALSILFSTPFLVAILAGPLLGEWIGWRRWVAILVGFSGVLLVTRPGVGGVHWAAIYSMASAVFYSLYIVATRVLSRSDPTDTTLFYSNLVGALAMLPVLPFVWSAPDSPGLLFLMAVFGAFGSFGHYLLIAAHRLAPASVLAPFMYTQLVWATGLGFLIFGDVPDSWTLAGAAVLIASGLYLLHRERVTGTA
jgi:drug/metabolite transporter (DMT)-like permease